MSSPSFPYFLINPAHEVIVRGESTPSQVMRGHNRRWQKFLFGSSVLAVLVIGVLFALESMGSLQVRGLTTYATVTRHAIEDQSAYDTVPRLYYLEYRYEVEGVVYVAQQNVNTGQYSALRDGHRVQIAYLPEDPTVSQIVSGRSPTLLWMACATGIGIGLVVLFTLYQFTQQRRYRQGKVIQGEILRAEQKMDTQRKLYVQLQYVFMSPEGLRIERSHILNGEKWTHKAPPQPGTPVFIQYASEREFQLL
ncbi:MAG: DUF3592 domain-containing protein [bacterium]|nr:DUF3592 domain-containing protein [bacterium]